MRLYGPGFRTAWTSAGLTPNWPMAWSRSPDCSAELNVLSAWTSVQCSAVQRRAHCVRPHAPRHASIMLTPCPTPDANHATTRPCYRNPTKHMTLHTRRGWGWRKTDGGCNQTDVSAQEKGAGLGGRRGKRMLYGGVWRGKAPVGIGGSTRLRAGLQRFARPPAAAAAWRP